MKKNYLFGLISLFTVLFMASCQEEDVFGGASDANTNVITYKVSTQQVATRAAVEAGQGAKADKLYYGVYELIKNEWKLIETSSVLRKDQALAITAGTPCEVPIRLAKQKKYSVIFWAQSENEKPLCSVNWGARQMSINTELLSNQESYDAFWGYDEVELNGAMSKNVGLKRPFAQLNIGTSDFADAVKAGVKVVSSAVTVKGLPTTLNLADGTVVEAQNTHAYGLAEIPSATEYAFPVEPAKYQYLALNYVLVGDEKSSLIDVELSYMDEDDLNYSSTFTAVPVRRNYRTNIYGTLLTNDANYTVNIEADIAGSYNPEDMFKDALTNGRKFTLLSDMTWPEGFTIPEGKNVEIDLNDNTLTVATTTVVEGNLEITNGNVDIDVVGDDELEFAFATLGGGTVDLSDVDVEVSGRSVAIYAQGSDNTININNVTMKVADGGHGISAPTYDAKDLNVNIIDSKLTGEMALYLCGAKGVTVTIDENSTVDVFGVYGCSDVTIVYTGKKPVVDGDGTCTNLNYYSQNEYPLHAALAEGGTITLTEDVVLTQPIALAAGVEATLNLNGKTLSGNFSKDGDNALINNSGKLTLTNGTFKNTAASGAAVINNSGELILGDDVTVEGAPFGESGYPAYAVVSSGTLTIEEGASISAERGCLKLSADGTTVINGGTFTNQDLGSKSFTSHVVDVEDGGSNQLTINGGTFQHLHAATSGGVVVCNRTEGTVYINGGNFSGGKYVEGQHNLSDYGYRGTFVVKGGTYSAEPAAKYIPEGYQVAENGGKFDVERIIVNASSASDVAAAIAEGSAVVLQGDITYNTTINKDAEINLNGNTFEAAGTINLGNNADLTMIGGNYEVNGTYGHVDVRPSTAEGSVVVYKDVNFSFNKLGPTYGPSTNRLGSVVEVCAIAIDANTKIRFENCTFGNAQVLFEGMSGETGTFEAEFVNCTFNALTSSAPIYVQNYVKGTITLTDCTFNLECTSSTASAVSVSSSSSTSVTINAENNTINATAATPYTFDASKGETEVHNVKVNGTPANIKFISCYGNTTVNETGTTKAGIAQ